jgi:hypothetical protein
MTGKARGSCEPSQLFLVAAHHDSSHVSQLWARPREFKKKKKNRF